MSTNKKIPVDLRKYFNEHDTPEACDVLFGEGVTDRIADAKGLKQALRYYAEKRHYPSRPELAHHCLLHNCDFQTGMDLCLQIF